MHVYTHNGRFQMFKNKNFKTFKTGLTAGFSNGKYRNRIMSFSLFFSVYLNKIFYVDIILDLEELYD